MSTELAASAVILNIRSVEPQDALKIYTEIAMENAVNSFLGTTGTHAEVLSRLKAKYNFTDRQIHEAIESTVRSALTAEMSKNYKGFVPIQVFNEWKSKGFGDFIGTATDVLVMFFENPTQRNYETVRGMVVRQAYLYGQGDILASYASADALMKRAKDAWHRIHPWVMRSQRSFSGFPAWPRTQAGRKRPVFLRFAWNARVTVTEFA